MDTEYDLQSREEILGASIDGFFLWLKHSGGIDISFNYKCDYVFKDELIDLLKQNFWDDYVDDLEDSHRAYQSDERARMSA